MIKINKKIDQDGEGICLHCPQMNPTTGYCRITGEYVNAFWSCRKFITPAEVPQPKAPRKKRVSPRKGVHTIAFRTEKVCSCCGILKPIDEFVRLKRSPDGHGCYCRMCNTIKKREFRKKGK